MGTAFQHNIGACVALATSVLPQSAGASTINGQAIDRFAHGHALSCVVHQVVGAVSGAPSAISITTKLQHSPDGATWADYIPPGASTVAITAALTAASTENRLSVDLSSANEWVREVTVIAFTGGTSPAALVAADLILGGEDRLQAT